MPLLVLHTEVSEEATKAAGGAFGTPGVSRLEQSWAGAGLRAAAHPDQARVTRPQIIGWYVLRAGE